MEPAVIGGAIGIAITVMFGKQAAEWSIRVLGKAVAEAIGDQLEPRWATSIRKEMDEALGPIHRELQITDGAEKWPNGSDSLPASMKTIYERQAETHSMVKDMVAQLEALLVGRTPEDHGEPEGTPDGF